MTVDPAIVTAVCDRIRPFMVDPTPAATDVCANIVPSMWAPAPRATAPCATQKTFRGDAPPCNVTAPCAPTAKAPATWKIHTSDALPTRVMLVAAAEATAESQKYRPGGKV